MGRPLALALLTQVLFVVLTATGQLNWLFNDASRRLGPAADYFAVYQAGIEVGEGCSVYGETPCKELVPYRYPYRYVPVFAQTAGQLSTLLPPWPSYWLWVAVLEATIILAMIWGARRLPGTWGALTPWLWALSAPIYLELFMGQFSLAMGFLIAGAMLLLDGGHGVGGVSLWAVSLGAKTNSALLTPLVLRRAGLPLTALTGLAVVLVNVPYFLSMPGSFEAFRANLSVLGQPALVDAGAQGMQSLLTIAVRQVNGGPWPEEAVWARLVLLAPLALLAVPMAVAAWRQPDPYVGGLGLMAVFFLVYPDVWEHHYTLLAPLLALTVLRRPDFRLQALLCWLVIALPTPYPVLEAAARGLAEYDAGAFDPQRLWPVWGVYWHHAWKPASALALWGLSFRWLLRLGAE